MSKTKNSEFIDDKFENFLSQCFSNGIPVAEVKSRIQHKLAVEQTLADVASRVKAEFEYLASDAGKALTEAYALYHNRTAHADKTEYDQAYSELCRKWLFLRHGVKVGDTIEIHAWAKPRVIRLTHVGLFFDRNEGGPARWCRVPWGAC